MIRVSRRPSAAFFRRHLLKAMGELTDCTPYVGVSREEVVARVCELANLCAKNPPWQVLSKADALPRIIGFTHRNYRAEHTKTPHTILCGDGTWALSRMGALAAAELLNADLPAYGPQDKSTEKPVKAPKPRQRVSPTPTPTPISIEIVVEESIEQPTVLEAAPVSIPVVEEPTVVESVGKIEVLDAMAEEPSVPRTGRRYQDVNLTAQWVREKGPELLPRLVQYLEGRFPTSRQHAMIEDHVQTFLANFISRDSLRAKIEAGESIPISQICTYARNSTFSQIRDNARRPVCRLFQGARTQKEREEAALTPDSWASRVYVKSDLHLSTGDRESAEGRRFSMDALPDASPSDYVQEKICWDQISDRLLETLRRRAPEDAEELYKLVEERYILELTVRECAERRGITRNQAQAKLRLAKAILGKDAEDILYGS